MRDDGAGGGAGNGTDGGEQPSRAVLLIAAAACSAVAALLALNIASAGTQREARGAPPGLEQPAAGPAHTVAAPSRP